MDEIWRDVESWEGFYQISNMGRVRSVDRIIEQLLGKNRQLKRRLMRGKILSLNPNPKSKYLIVGFTRPRQKVIYRYVHDLVARAFLGPPGEGEEVCHRDNDRQNNRDSNLRWGTRSSNALDRHEHGTMNQARGEDHYWHKLTEADVRWVRDNQHSMTHREMAAVFGVSHSVIGSILRNKTWKHVISCSA